MPTASLISSAWHCGCPYLPSEIPETPSQDSVTIPLLKLSDFLQHLLNKYEQLMFGGLTADASRELVGNFWSRYESHHKDHIVYTLPEEERPFCIPLMLHGDKGRSLQKSPIFVLSFQFPWGLPPAMLNKVAYDPSRSTRNVVSPRLNLPCKARAKKRAFRETDFCDCTRNDPSKFLDASSPNSHQRHNNKGHSYLSRFLISAVPAKTYKKNCNALPDLLKQVSSELKQLFRLGLTQSKSAERYRFVLIGAKGDAEWHFEAGNFNRSFHQIGPQNHLKICPLCDAGAEGISYTDTSSAPEWLPTVGASDPWDAGNEPPLLEAPFSRSFPANIYKCDPFHILKYGIFRDTAASCIIRLCDLEYFDFDDSPFFNVPDRLSRAFAFYHMWCLANKKCATLKGFTRDNMKYPNASSFPWFTCKGSEVILLLMWLDYELTLFLRNPKQEGHRKFLQAMQQTIQGGLTYIGIMHSHGLWLPICCAKVQLDAGFSFVRGYAWLAEYCMGKKVSGFRLRPKLH